MLKRIFASLVLCLPVYQAIAGVELDLGAPPQYKPLFESDTPGETAALAPGQVRLSRSEIDRLLMSRRGTVMNLPSIDAFAGRQAAPLDFRRVELQAPGARFYLVSGEGQVELQPRERHVYLATSEDTSVGMVVDPEDGAVSGVMNHKGQYMQIGGNFATALQVQDVVESPDTAAQCGNETIDMNNARQSITALDQPQSASAAAAGTAISYQATVAIETDNEWMDGFGDDEAAAMDWIIDLFVAMNVFYERDVELQLLIGDVYLRTLPDEYSVTGSSSAKLDEFSEYWTNNMGGVERSFAAMLSGRDIGPFSFSGIAWVDVYCEDGWYYQPFDRYIGSYSYNAVGSGWQAASAALYVGHELGHNLGSGHTHCYSPPIDNCYNGQSGCYQGAVSCPVGDQKGTIMSYCHVGAPSGAGCGTSKKEFHPTVQANIENHLAANLGSCIAEYQDVTPDPQPEFQASPAAGSLIDLGDQQVGSEGTAASIVVNNPGDAELTLGCTLGGAQAASFNITACVASVPAGGNTDLGVSCEPVQSGLNQATLTVTSNDADEPSNVYDLACNGTQVLEPEFDSTPAAGATIGFGTQEVNTSGAVQVVTVQNPGTASLSLSCNVTGSGSSSFNIVACPASVSPAGSVAVQVNCEPASAGLKQANLRISSNDADEGQNTYSLTCTGQDPVPPAEDVIFADDFGS